MKLLGFVFLMQVLFINCKAQDNLSVIVDSLAKISRVKADRVLFHFDNELLPKLLYSFEDKYYLLLIYKQDSYEEYYIETDSTGKIVHFCSLKNGEYKNRRQKKQAEQYNKLLNEGDPFNFNQYHTNYITKMPEATYFAGKPTYFVVKDTNGKRYGEYRLSAITTPSLINKNLWTYLFKRLSDEIEIAHK